jgi:hypothetical protein
LEDPEIKTLVLDVLKPHSPSLPEFASYLAEFEGLTRVDITLVEMDERTESLKVVLNGTAINYDALKEYMGRQGAVIHSVDHVIVEK